MTKIVMAYIGFLLLAIQFSSHVHAQNATTQSPAMNATTEAGGASSNTTKMPDVTTKMPNVTTKMPNVTTKMPDVTTKNITIPKGASASLQSSAVTLLIHIAVAGSLIQGRF
ncbi:uncharacterized protein ACWYII_036968 [Salvelinus alpinus]